MFKNVSIKWRIVYVIIAIFVAIGIYCAVINNTAISLGEEIFESASQIEAQEKRREDLLYGMVDLIEDYNEYESSTLEQITNAKESIKEGDTDVARESIDIIFKTYPELKAYEAYDNLSNDLAISENLISQYRITYNKQIKNYNKFVKVFPNNYILNTLGYNIIETQYLEFGASSDAPQDLFEKE